MSAAPDARRDRDLPPGRLEALPALPGAPGLHRQGPLRPPLRRARRARALLGRGALGAPGREPRPRPRAHGRHRRLERLGQVHAAQGARRHPQADRRSGLRARAGVRPDRARRRLPPGVHRAREHLHQRRPAGPLPRGDPRAVRRDRRLRRARDLRRQPRQDLLVGDVHAARLRDRGHGGPGRPPDRRGAGRRRRGLPAPVRGQDPGVQGAREDDRARLPRPRQHRAALRRGGVARPGATPGPRARRGRSWAATWTTWRARKPGRSAWSTRRPRRSPGRAPPRAGAAGRSS